MNHDQPIADVIDKLEHATHSTDKTLGEVLDEFGNAAYSSTLLSVSILLVSPLSAVPLFASVCGLTIFLIATGMLARDGLISSIGLMILSGVAASIYTAVSFATEI